MNYRIQPSEFTGGDVCVPGDKSLSHRALLLGAIADGSATVSGFLPGDDCLRTLAAIRALGVTVHQEDATTLVIEGAGLEGLSQADADLDLGNSGTAMRLLAGILSGQSFDSRLVGDASLSRRPMDRIIKPLTMMGAHIESEEGRPPLTIVGGNKLRGITYSMPVASAQVKSSVLLAGLFASGETTVLEPATTRDHTERMLEAMGVGLHRAERRVTMAGWQQPKACDFHVPADLSSATFAIIATLLSESAQATIRNVCVNPTRTGVIEILRSMGADIKLENAGLAGMEPVADVVVKSSWLRGVEVDPSMVSLAIDEFPALFVAAALATGVTRFSGLAELRVKESDRINVMVRGLQALGTDVIETKDGATVIGGRLKAGKVETGGDHRVAMAFATGASVADGPIEVCDTRNVDTSFPGFVDFMQGHGIDITVQLTADK